MDKYNIPELKDYVYLKNIQILKNYVNIDNTLNRNKVDNCTNLIVFDVLRIYPKLVKTIDKLKKCIEYVDNIKLNYDKLKDTVITKENFYNHLLNSPYIETDIKRFVSKYNRKSSPELKRQYIKKVYKKFKFYLKNIIYSKNNTENTVNLYETFPQKELMTICKFIDFCGDKSMDCYDIYSDVIELIFDDLFYCYQYVYLIFRVL